MYMRTCVCMCHACVLVRSVGGWGVVHPVPVLWASPSCIDVIGGRGSGAPALGLSCSAGGSAPRCSSVDAGTTELGHSWASPGLQEPQGTVFLKENLFMLMWVSSSLFHSVNSKVYSPVVQRTRRE